MVLEGLRKAEIFLGHLRKLGYQREDGKVLRVEHYDQEFSKKQYSSLLNELLGSLQARLLDDGEVARLEYLANLGLLDSLLEGTEVVEDRDDVRGQEGERGEVTQLEELIQRYTRMLDNLEVEERALEAELSNAQETTLPRTGLEDFAGLLPTGSQEQISSIAHRRAELDEAIRNAVAQSIASLDRPIDTNSEESPSYRFLTVPNEDLLRQWWHPLDYSYYESKVATALGQLNKLLEVDVKVEEVLQDEYKLNHRRSLYYRAVLTNVCDLERRRLALNMLFSSICSRYCDHWQGDLEEISRALAEAGGAIRELEEVRSSAGQHRQQVLPHGLGGFADSLQWDCEAMRQRLHSIKSSHSALVQLADRLVGPDGDVNIVASEVRSTEEQLRQISLNISNILQESLSTESQKRMLQLKS